MKCVSSYFVRLFILFIAFSGSEADAQNISYNFSYQENIISDYSAIMNTTTREMARKDSTIVSGILSIRYISRDSIAAQIKTRFQTSTFNSAIMPPIITFTGTLDSNHRLQRLSLPDSLINLAPTLIAWLSEINVYAPAQGMSIETKMDGNFSVNYSFSESTGKRSLQKSIPELIKGAGSSQSIVFDSYKYHANYDRNQSRVESISMTEKKRQILGRRTLACIERTFTLRNAQLTTGFGPLSNTGLFSLELYPRFNETDRRRKIAQALIRQETWHSVSGRFASVDQMSDEQQFRLKSILRSMLILDSSLAALMNEVLDSAVSSPVLRNLIETAFIESNTSAGQSFINKELLRNSANYEKLKDILIKVTAANAFSEKVEPTLTSLLESTEEPDMRRMLSLALSNYSIKIKESRAAEYERINEQILRPYRTGIDDTLQYLYLVGNSGYEKEAPFLISIIDRYNKYDVVFAFRNFNGAVADSIIHDFILNTNEGAMNIASLMPSRKLDSFFSTNLISRIFIADRDNDSTFLKALQYLFDHRSESSEDIEKLMSHKFIMPAYRKEVEEFIIQNQLCAGARN